MRSKSQMEKAFKRMEEPSYAIVSPLGRSTARPIPRACALPNFKQKIIGFVWTIFTHGDALADIIEKLLRERFAELKFVKLPSGKSGKWGGYPQEDLPDVVKESGVDAVIALVGG